MGNKNSHPICPDVGGYNDNGVPIAGSLSLQHIMLIAGGACTAVTLALSLPLLFKHLHRYTVPSEQRQVVRLIFTPVVFAVFNLLGIAFYHASIYITIIADLYEAFALASFFLLLVNFVVPDVSNQEAFFAATENRSRKGEPIAGGSLSWFKYIWTVVFLYCVVKTILFIAQEASQATGTYCFTSNNAHFGHIWIQIFGSITVAMAVLSIIRFYRRFRGGMAHHKPLAKLISFKMIVFTNMIQTLIFSFLNSGRHLGGNSKVTHLDLWLGIPSLLVCFEQIIFSAFFHYSFRSQEYRALKTADGRQLSFLQAAAHAINPSDLIAGIVRAFTYVTSLIGRSRSSSSNGMVGYPQTTYRGNSNQSEGLPMANETYQKPPQYVRQ